MNQRRHTLRVANAIYKSVFTRFTGTCHTSYQNSRAQFYRSKLRLFTSSRVGGFSYVLKGMRRGMDYIHLPT
ncbi:MAG: hypothetical protein ACXV2D_09450, partial [Halobacteriota archaeon]